LTALNFSAPTPIQSAGIPPALAGRDLVLQAETGSGKTFAYALPLIQPLEGRVKTVRGLVIVPTRELAVQVTAEINRVAQAQEVRAIAIYGGKDVETQIQALREGAAVVVGTPGRLRDVFSRGVLSLKRVRTVVLDEADELLDRGFAKDLEVLLQACPADRQTILASATMPPAVERLVSRWMNEPERVTVNQGAPATGISHYWVQAHPRHKIGKLVQVLANQNPEQAIVFVAKREETEHVARWLRKEGFRADWIHGEMAQPHRQDVMDRFRFGEVSILVATDLAARGLDVPGVSHVINYDVPMNPEIYVHRVGRTGRAGESGIAITLVGSDERFSFSKIRAGFPVKELKGKVDKGPRSTQAAPAAKGKQGPEAFEPGKPFAGKPFSGKPFSDKAAAGRPASGKPSLGKSAPGKPVMSRRPAFDMDLPPGWVLDDAPEQPFKPAKAAKPVKKDGRPPRALPKKGPGLDWNEDRTGNKPRRGPKPPKK
jgi:superfamily II DNA/RNA helicase